MASWFSWQIGIVLYLFDLDDALFYAVVYGTEVEEYIK